MSAHACEQEQQKYTRSYFSLALKRARASFSFSFFFIYLKSGAMNGKLASHTQTLDHIGELGVRMGVSERKALCRRVPTSR